MLSTIIALIAATASTDAAPASSVPGRVVQGGAFGKLTATYHAGPALYCIRSGWKSASLATNRRVRSDDCGTAADWRRRGIAFAPPATAQARHRSDTAADQVAAR